MRKPLDAGFTLLELLIVVAIVGILAAVAIPGLLRARISGNEASAIGSLRVVNTSQQAYSSSCGGGFYAASLTILADPAPVGTGFISPDLGASDIVEKSGFRLVMEPGSESVNAVRDGCNPSGTADNLFSSYYASNEPLNPGLSGTRWFWTNSLGTIYVSDTDDFDAEDVGNVPSTVGEVLQ